jgi:lysophospholipase L1-like esterase
MIATALKNLVLICVLLLLNVHVLQSQDHQKFKVEVDTLLKRYDHANLKKAIVFTGSSSIRLWTDLNQRFPDQNILNTGFGGSQMSDLFYYTDELIVKYKPKRIFIYEGDNDLGTGKTPDEILRDASKVLKLIRCGLPKRVKVFFITPKPSIRRWEQKKMYEDYISKLKAWADKQKNVGVIDVWTPMLDASGDLKRDLFVADDLHMNSKGYDIWTSVINPYLKKKH